MTTFKTILGSAAVLLSLSVSAQAQDATADTVVATVGDTEITLGEMIIARTRLPQQFQSMPADLLFEGIMDQLIQQQLLADAAGAPTPRVEMTLKHERRSLMANTYIEDITVGATTEEALQEAFEERFADAEGDEEYNASHLLVETAEEAEAAKARIDGGEAFADVAREVSTGPSGPNGGELGWFGAGQMVTPFEEAVMSMDVGDVVGPVETQFGFHVITLNEKRMTEAPTFEDMRGQLFAELQEAAIQARLDELTAQTEVVRPEDGAFDPELLSNFDLIAN